MNSEAIASDFEPVNTGGAQLLRLALHDSIRIGRECGELPPLPMENTMSSHGDLPAVRLAGESIEALREEIRAAAKMAVKEAASQVVTQLLTPERARDLFVVFFAVMREQLASGAGNWMLGGIWGVVRKFFWAGLALAGLLIIGGPALVKALWVAFWTHVSKT